MFLGAQDIQLGVNESLLDTSRVVSSMVDGIMARVGGHHEIEASIHLVHDLFSTSVLGVLTLFLIDFGKGVQCASHQCTFR